MAGVLGKALPSPRDMSTSGLCQEHLLARKRLRTCTTAAGHNVSGTARLRQNLARSYVLDCNTRHKRVMALVATSQQSTAPSTPLLQLQKTLQDSGATVDALDLSYRQSVATRKLRQGEVIPVECAAQPLLHTACCQGAGHLVLFCRCC